jgi:hypothetical protein
MGHDVMVATVPGQVSLRTLQEGLRHDVLHLLPPVADFIASMKPQDRHLGGLVPLRIRHRILSRQC